MSIKEWITRSKWFPSKYNLHKNRKFKWMRKYFLKQKAQECYKSQNDYLMYNETVL